MASKLKRIIIHWTAGYSYPNNIETQRYHFLVDKDGKVYDGYHKPEDNIDCTDGDYAPHTGGGNTGAIGISMCGMVGFDTIKKNTKSPITLEQMEATCKKCAELCKEYDISPNVKTIMTHAMFGLLYPKTISHGKIDIIYLPPIKLYGVEECNKTLRNKVMWYYNRLK